MVLFDRKAGQNNDFLTNRGSVDFLISRLLGQSVGQLIFLKSVIWSVGRSVDFLPCRLFG